MDNFEKSFDRVFGHEGGFQNDPADRGNWTTGKIGQGELKGTKFGISAMSYPHLNIERLTLEEAKAIYRRDYWDAMRMDRFSRAMQYQLFDASINHGMYNARRILQRALGVKDDGIVGPITMRAIESMSNDDLLFRFLAERLQFITKVGTWGTYGKGWTLRIAQNLRYAAGDN